MSQHFSQRDHRGWTVLTLGTDELTLDLVPGKGGDILSLTRVSDGLQLLGSTPWGLRRRGQLTPPGSVASSAADAWAGGWRPLFPNAGRSAVSGGVELGETGEATLADYDWAEIDEGVELSTRLSRMPFEVIRRISCVDATVTLTETLRNVGGEEISGMWGHQLMLSGPLLDPGATFDCGASVVRPDSDVVSSVSWDDLMPWPRAHGVNGLVNLRTVPAADSEETRKAYLSDFDEPRATLTNTALGAALSVGWDAEVWPYLWYELEAGRDTGYPWYKSGYHLLLTPASSWPARGIHEARRLSELAVFAPGAENTATMTVTVTSV